MTDHPTVWRLANMADVSASPDSEDSPGAVFLFSVYRDWQERREYAGGPLDDDAIAEIADSAPDVYTHKRWQEFVDLAAYFEDVGDYGSPSADDLTNTVAGVALYVIAERLVRALEDEAGEADDDDGDPDDLAYDPEDADRTDDSSPNTSDR